MDTKYLGEFMPDIEKLVEEYKTATTERRRAEIEEAVWNTVTNKREILRRDAVHKVLNCGTITQVRAIILHADGPVSDLLWDNIDNKGMPTRTAVRLLRDAKQRRNDAHIPLLDALISVLKDYESSGYVTTTPDGKVLRKKPPSKLPSREDVKPGSKKTQQSTALWTTVRNAFAEEMATRLLGLDKSVADSLWEDFELEVQCLLDTFQGKIHYVKTREFSGLGSTVHTISRREVVHACRTLNMEPPTSQSKPVDMKKAKTNKRELSKAYHPDTNGGSEDSRQRYEEVIAAYNLLVKYMATFQSKPTSDSQSTAVG